MNHACVCYMYTTYETSITSGGSRPWAKEGVRGSGFFFACLADFSSFCDFIFFYMK